MLTSNKQDWGTPQKVFNDLDDEFRFTLDACATPENAKCPYFYTPESDGLKQVWEGRVFMNPPYGNQLTALWVRKAYESAQTTADIVVCLIPARTDTRWWHDCCMKGEVRFIKGRLRFEGARYNAPFPSAIVVFRNPNLLKTVDPLS